MRDTTRKHNHVKTRLCFWQQYWRGGHSPSLSVTCAKQRYCCTVNRILFACVIDSSSITVRIHHSLLHCCVHSDIGKGGVLLPFYSPRHSNSLFGHVLSQQYAHHCFSGSRAHLYTLTDTLAPRLVLLTEIFTK